MSLTKKLANFIHPDDAPNQCKRDARCHWKDGHEGECRPLALAVTTQLRTVARDLVAGLRERWRQS